MQNEAERIILRYCPSIWEVQCRMKRRGLYWGTVKALGGTMQNEAERIILRYLPITWRYNAEWSGEDYTEVPSKHLEVQCKMKRRGLYWDTFQLLGGTMQNEAERIILRHCPSIWEVPCRLKRRELCWGIVSKSGGTMYNEEKWLMLMYSPNILRYHS